MEYTGRIIPCAQRVGLKQDVYEEKISSELVIIYWSFSISSHTHSSNISPIIDPMCLVMSLIWIICPPGNNLLFFGMRSMAVVKIFSLDMPDKTPIGLLRAM